MTIEMANRLVQLRRNSGLSQEELAAKLGVSRQAVSKWERAEASPDTDNLMALADLYGVTLDELVRPAPSTPPSDESPADDSQPTSDEDDEDDQHHHRHGFPHFDRHGFHVTGGDEEVHIGWKGVHVKDIDEEVHVGWNGVHVQDGNGEVHVSPNGIYVDNTDHHIHMDGEEFANWKRNRIYRVFKGIPVWMFTVIAYLLLGFLGGWWHPGWLVFFAIPLYDSLIKAIFKRRITEFVYPVLVVGVYLLLGFLGNWWHPGWVVFLTIPLYYSIAALFRKR